MRLLLCGDTHIGCLLGLGRAKPSGGNTRVDDYERTLNYIADYAIKNNIDVFIQTGDAFDSRTPTPEHMNVLNRVLHKLSMASITSVVIMGNHDYCRTGETFTSAISSLAAKEYPNVRLVLEPTVLKLHRQDDDNINLVLLPYRDRRMFPGKTTEEDSLLYEQEVALLLDECKDGSPIIGVGHNFYYDGSYNDFGGAEILVKVDAFKNFDLIAMGHQHQFKIVRKKSPIALYTGSMEKINFGDQDIDKYFIDYDTKTKQTKVLKSPTRALQDLFLDLSQFDYDDFWFQLREQIKLQDLKEKIVRLKLSVKDTLMSSVSKSEVEKILYEAGSFFVSKVIVEPVFTRMVRDDRILDSKDDYSMFKSFVETQDGIEPEDRDYILSEVKKIIESPR